jgi:hypothetical protein
MTINRVSERYENASQAERSDIETQASVSKTSIRAIELPPRPRHDLHTHSLDVSLIHSYDICPLCRTRHNAVKDN